MSSILNKELTLNVQLSNWSNVKVYAKFRPVMIVRIGASKTVEATVMLDVRIE